MKNDSVKTSFLFNERNLTGSFVLPPIFHLLVFGVKHPDSKIEIDENDLVEFEFLRMVLNSLDVLTSL